MIHPLTEDRLRWLVRERMNLTLDGAVEIAKGASCLLAEIEHLKAQLDAMTKERDLALANADGVYAKLMPENEQMKAKLDAMAKDYGMSDYDMLLLRIEHQDAEIERLRAALKTCRCPGGGWNGMSDDVEPNVENCIAAGACGCDCGLALRNDQQTAPQSWLEAKKEIDAGWPDE